MLEAARVSVTEAGAVPVGTVGIGELADAISLAAVLESQAAAMR